MPRKGSRASSLLRQLQDGALEIVATTRELKRELGESAARTVTAKKAAARRAERSKRDEGD